MNAAIIETNSPEQQTAPVVEPPISILQRLKAHAPRGRWLAGPEVNPDMLRARMKELFWGISESTILKEASARIDQMLAIAAVVEPMPVAVELQVAAAQEDLPLAC
ncbi:MAG: hypothetical protein L0Y58_19755 [Verrucomicrobia subdivision 3 bacterium]|nr:hypothetical protein [Limisphaerales bacterium]